ncbi:outer membrane receptor for ferric coprogen and ferric-rhodotorulic acid [Pseudomonas sp. BIGb0408]|uniref:Outer membrane receptor for ferric coprogen and ferric-rhodotorulic acid n=2 Tax=Pseudomonadales TaxID=72274 RepID=A0A7Y9XT75_9GAMM|nr:MULTISPECIES: TonB-dependent siderophore receptor [Pseudomonas]MCW2294887.1 outer membrane receptor for ferric coprogen and ferric-rhodotorulic acid [Pseudomonas sp. BIGb0408]NYH75839.1 outer membrane receptor for ferric coprogen and ferric-rhodotorulic acid [Pseudomonas flavescens]
MNPHAMAGAGCARRPLPCAPSLLAVAITLAGIAMPLMAHAQQAAQGDSGSTVVLEPQDGTLELEATSVTSNQLGTITEESQSYTPGSIATATRLVLTPRETPQSISVVTRKRMDDFGLTSIDDVMRHTPGVSIVTYDTERTEYYARGFAINNFQYDGIPMSRDSAYSAGNTLSDMAIYDRIEVLKGATGLLTGSGDPGATINLIRKKPTHEFSGHLSAGIGSWDDYRTEIDVGGPLTPTGNVRGRAVAAYQDKHSFQDNYERKTNVYYGILEFDLSEDTLLSVGADYQDNKPEGSSWGSMPIFDSNGNFNKVSRSFNPGTNWSGWEQYTRTVFATLEHNFANGWLAKMQLNHQINGYDATLGSASAGNPNPADGSGARQWQGKYVGETKADAADGYVSGSYQLFGREHELVVGGSIARRKTDRDGYAFFGPDVDDFYSWNGNVPEPDWGAPTNDKETIRENGLYTTSRFNLQDDLKLILGARLANYRGEDTKKSGVVVPYAGLIYDLTDTISAYTSYTTIFKPQSSRDRQGRTLEPQEGDNYEIGLKGEFYDGRLNASLAYFEIHQDNRPQADGFINGTAEQAFRAVQGVKTKGYEAEVSGELTPGWQLQAGYSHKIARVDGRKLSTVEPEDQFSVYTTYNLKGQLEPLTVGGGARWQSRSWGSVWNAPRARNEDFGQSAYWLLDVMAKYQVTDNLSATLNVNNLLDKKYLTIMDFYSVYSWGEPRNVMLTTRYDF